LNCVLFINREIYEKLFMTTCTECGIGELTPSTWNMDVRHGDTTIRVEGLECFVCGHCGADPVFTDQIRRNQLRIADAKRAADSLWTSADITAFRDRHHLTQAQAADLFGGGSNAFSKYERGDVIQSIAMDRLLKAANAVPGVLDFLRLEAGLPSQINAEIPHGYVTGGILQIVDQQLLQSSISGTATVASMADYREQRRRA